MSVGLVVLVSTLVPPVREGILRAAGHALVINEAVEAADIVVVPVWSGSEGAIEAADLVRTGIATRVAVLAGPSSRADKELTRRGVAYRDETEVWTELLNSLGVGKVEIIPQRAAGSEDEGAVLHSWFRQNAFRSAVLISTPDHSRRLRRVLRRSFGGEETRIAIQLTRYSEFDPDRWWETRAGLRIEIVELEKLLLDFLRHPIS